jgi:phosphoglycolate phosphatase
MLAAVAFDLDGTLVDSAPDLVLAINAMLAALGRNTQADATVHHWIGNGAEVLVKRALSGRSEICDSLEPDLYVRARTLFDRFYSENICVNSRLYEGVSEALKQLSDLQIPLVLVTNKPLLFTGPLLEKLDIAHYFKHILGGDSLSRKKPDPLPLLHVAELLGVSPSQMVMVGDSKNDIQAAKAAGCPSYGLTYGYNYGEAIGQYEPNWVESDLKALVALFKK